MKTDLYTKTVLTVIAFSLAVLAFKQLNLIPSAIADTPQYNPFGVFPTNSDGSLNVRILDAQTMDVVIKGIQTYDALNVDISDISTSDELDVNIDEIGGSYISHGGPIKVKLN